MQIKTPLIGSFLMQYVFNEQSNVKSLNSHTVLTLLSFFLKITKRLAT